MIYIKLIIKELTPIFLTSTIFISLFLTVAQFVSFSDTIFNLSVRLNDLIKIILVLIPSSFLFSLPISGIITVFISIIRLTKDNELLALQAAGISYSKIFIPFFYFSILLFIVSFFTASFIYPLSIRGFKDILRELLESSLTKRLPEKTIIQPIPNIIFYIEKIDADYTLNSIFIRDFRDKTLPVNIYAAKGRIFINRDTKEYIITLNNGILLIKDFDSDKTDVLTFKDYSMKITRDIKGIKESRGELDLISLYNRMHDKGIKESKRILYRCEFHKRLALTFGAFLLCMISFPISIQFDKTSTTGGISIGITLFLIYYIFLTLVTNLAETGKTHPSIIWIPNLVLIALNLVMMKKKVFI